VSERVLTPEEVDTLVSFCESAREVGSQPDNLDRLIATVRAAWQERDKAIEHECEANVKFAGAWAERDSARRWAQAWKCDCKRRRRGYRLALENIDKWVALTHKQQDRAECAEAEVERLKGLCQEAIAQRNEAMAVAEDAATLAEQLSLAAQAITDAMRALVDYDWPGFKAASARVGEILATMEVKQ